MSVHESIRVEPETMQISKGSCVIWFNRAAANEVKVVFEEGKKCAAVTDAAVGFGMDDYGQCFVTSWLPFGGTSSLRFKEAGTFEYAIEIGKLEDKGKRVARGKIIVRAE
jgi:hypothetical protein